MNQILTTQKIYVTPELKRKKKLYKLDFFLSVFLVCILFSFYIYAEYDRNKAEEVSRDILSNVAYAEVIIPKKKEPVADNTTVKVEDNIIMVVLDVEQQEEINVDDLLADLNTEPEETTIIHPKENIRYDVDGEYYTVAIVTIPKIGIEYPVLSRTSESLLRISPNKWWGPDPNEVGNFCIIGHNYRNKLFFSKVPTLENGDIVYLKDMTQRTITYEVYDKYVVDPADTACTTQLTDGRKEVTLITCTNDSKQRVVLKCREVK